MLRTEFSRFSEGKCPVKSNGLTAHTHWHRIGASTQWPHLRSHILPPYSQKFRAIKWALSLPACPHVQHSVFHIPQHTTRAKQLIGAPLDSKQEVSLWLTSLPSQFRRCAQERSNILTTQFIIKQSSKESFTLKEASQGVINQVYKENSHSSWIQVLYLFMSALLILK